MFVRTLVTAAGPRDVPVTVFAGYLTPGNRHLDKRHTAWTPVTLRERAGSAGGPCKKKDETSRDIGIASLPLRACRPSGGFVVGTLSAAEAAVKRF